MDTFSQTPVTNNTQGVNENMILTSGRLYKSDALTETLNNLTINDDGYYESDTANANYDKDNIVSNPKVATHTSELWIPSVRHLSRPTHKE